MAIKTKEELEQLLEDIQSRLSVVETAQTKPEEKSKDEESKDETSKETTEEKTDEVESEDEIEKLLNS